MKSSRKVVLSGLLVLSILFCGCAMQGGDSNNAESQLAPTLTPTPLPKINLSAEIWKACENIEGGLWELVGINETYEGPLKVLAILDRSDNETLEFLRYNLNGSDVEIISMYYDELNESAKQAVWRVLVHYGLTEELPIVMVVKPPIVFISTGKPVLPISDGVLEAFWAYHPLSLFSSKGTSVAIVIKNNSSYLDRAIRISDWLQTYGIRNNIYYDVERYGAASANVLNEVLSPEYSDYVVIANNSKLEKILPIEEGLKELEKMIGLSQPTSTNISNITKVENVTVYFVYSPMCPHCEKVKPYIDSLAKNYTWVNFVYCDVSNPDDLCKEVIGKYRVSFVPTVIVTIDGDLMAKFVGEDEVRNLDILLESLEEKR